MALLPVSDKTDTERKETFDIFRQSPLSNKWRSVTFQSLCLTILDPSSQPNPLPLDRECIAKLGNDNVEHCRQRIRSVVAEIAAVTQPGGNTRNTEPRYSDFEAEVEAIVRLAFDIAIQFGVNQACLSLVTPPAGEVVIIGPEYHDCEDADEHRGTRSKVDFVVSPGLIRVGDGKSEMSKKYPIVPCEIFAADMS